MIVATKFLEYKWLLKWGLGLLVFYFPKEGEELQSISISFCP